MLNSDIATGADHDELIVTVCRKAGVTPEMTLGFRDLTDFLEEFLKMYYGRTSNLICAGHTTPDVAIAADRADLKVVEALGESPFTGDVKSALSLVENESDIIYVGNPNRITGANFSTADLRSLVAAVPEGALIIDEHFYEHFGITGLPLLKEHSNVIVLRSLTAPYGLRSLDAGFAVAHGHFMARMKDSLTLGSISRATSRTILSGLADRDAMTVDVKKTHDESLRLALSLTRLGIQCRLSATDFLLMRVAHPKDVGNVLVANKVSIENLDGYPKLRNYMRYHIGSPPVNDRLIQAFKKMPASNFRMSGVDSRAAIQRRRKLVSTELRRSGRRSEGESGGPAMERRTVFEVTNN